MKISEAVSIVRSDNKAYSDDARLSDRYIWQKIKQKTLFFIKRKNDQFNMNGSFVYTTLDCLEMEMVDSVNCCKEIPICKILRSVVKVPKIASSDSGLIMNGMFTLDNQGVSFITINDVGRLSKSKYKPQGIKAFIKDDYLFIPFRDTPKAVSIEAFFENPEEVYFLNECVKKDFCVNAYDMEWKAPSDIRDAILLEVNKDLFGIHNRVVNDENIDKNESIK